MYKIKFLRKKTKYFLVTIPLISSVAVLRIKICPMDGADGPRAGNTGGNKAAGSRRTNDYDAAPRKVYGHCREREGCLLFLSLGRSLHVESYIVYSCGSYERGVTSYLGLGIVEVHPKALVEELGSLRSVAQQ